MGNLACSLGIDTGVGQRRRRQTVLNVVPDRLDGAEVKLDLLSGLGGVDKLRLDVVLGGERNLGHFEVGERGVPEFCNESVIEQIWTYLSS